MEIGSFRIEDASTESTSSAAHAAGRGAWTVHWKTERLSVEGETRFDNVYRPLQADPHAIGLTIDVGPKQGVYLCSVATGTPRCKKVAAKRFVSHETFSADGRWMVADAHVYDTATLESVAELPPVSAQGVVALVTVAPDLSAFASSRFFTTSNGVDQWGHSREIIVRTMDGALIERFPIDDRPWVETDNLGAPKWLVDVESIWYARHLDWEHRGGAWHLVPAAERRPWPDATRAGP